MAIDLASSSTSNGYQKVSNFLLLCSAATDFYNSEFNSSDASENKLSNSVKKTVKKSTCALTFDDIRYLPIKSLIDKFSEMTSDELTKKYSYKCLLLPEKCTMTFKSFGNEKKACEKIKSHLISHVNQLISEQEANNNVSDLIFVPRSPTSSSRQTEKNSKKSVKKHRIRLHLPKKADPSLSRKNVFKTSRKEKNAELNEKKLKRKLHSSKKPVAEIKNGVSKDKTKLYTSVYLPKEGSSKDFLDDNYQSDEKPMEKWSGEYAEDEEVEFCSNYSKHLKDIFFSNDAAKEKLSESDSELVYDLDECENIPEKNNLSTFTSSSNFEQSYIFLQDHNYASYEEVKDSKPSSTTVKYEDPYLLSLLGKPKSTLVIMSPPFPHVHIPCGFHLAEIIEIDKVECFCGAEECSRFSKRPSAPSIVKNEMEEMETDEPMSDSEEKYSSAFYKMNGASSSVLECVDNIVNNKPSSSCVPKNEISANENDENVNMQKVERELALMYIAKLHSKGKKKIADSLICQICRDKTFTAQATLIHHYRSHAGIKPYICEICSAKFTRQHSLNYHMLIHENRSRFTCGFCGRTFRHPSHYKEHLRRHTGETPFHCTDCNMHFKTRNTFKRHLKTRHGKLLTVGGIEDLNNE